MAILSSGEARPRKPVRTVMEAGGWSGAQIGSELQAQKKVKLAPWLPPSVCFWCAAPW